MKTDVEIIDEALTHLVPSSPEEIKDDIKAAKMIKKKNNNTKFMINKYENKKFDDKETRIKYDKEICMKLKDLKKDFIPLFQIYNILVDKQKSYYLKHYFVVKKNGESSVSEDKIDDYFEQPVIVLNLCLLYDEEKYYFNVVKGILNFMDSQFEDSYKKQYSLTQYIDDKNGKKYYEDNNLAFNNNCIAIVKDINRILTEYEFNKDRYIENSTQTERKELLDKMPEDKFKSLIRKARLKYDEILLNIFSSSNNNDDILLKIKALPEKDQEKYCELKDFLEEYLEIIALKNDYSQTKKSTDKKINSLEQAIKEQNKTINSQNNTISSQNTKIENLANENVAIKEKLNFMEKVVNSSLSRKVINHCMNNIVKKYKDSVKVEENIKDKSFKIIITKDINEVSVKDSNHLLDSLFKKKDLCNDFVHLDGVRKPAFIEDIWDIVLKFISLDKKEEENFNKIITKDIKESFNFSQKDEPLNIKNIK